jgi:hypothetical protein
MSAQRRMWSARPHKAKGATEEGRSYVNRE